MPKAGFEPTITASERSKTVHASDRDRQLLYSYTTFPPSIRNEKRGGGTRVCTCRAVCSGAHLLADEKSLEMSGQYKNVTRMSPSDFEFLINLIGPKCEVFHLRGSCSNPERAGSYVTVFRLRAIRILASNTFLKLRNK
jgi:hypothetical protein